MRHGPYERPVAGDQRGDQRFAWLQHRARLSERDRLGIDQLGVGREFRLDLGGQHVRAIPKRLDPVSQLADDLRILLGAGLAEGIGEAVIQRRDLILRVLFSPNDLGQARAMHGGADSVGVDRPLDRARSRGVGEAKGLGRRVDAPLTLVRRAPRVGQQAHVRAERDDETRIRPPRGRGLVLDV